MVCHELLTEILDSWRPRHTSVCAVYRLVCVTADMPPVVLYSDYYNFDFYNLEVAAAIVIVVVEEVVVVVVVAVIVVPFAQMLYWNIMLIVNRSLALPLALPCWQPSPSSSHQELPLLRVCSVKPSPGVRRKRSRRVMGHYASATAL